MVNLCYLEVHKVQPRCDVMYLLATLVAITFKKNYKGKKKSFFGRKYYLLLTLINFHCLWKVALDNRLAAMLSKFMHQSFAALATL